MRWPGILIIVIVTAVACIVGMGALGRMSGVGKPAKPPARVIVAQPTRGTLAEIVEAPGNVEPRKDVSISARISATLQSLPFEEGDRVCDGKGEGGEASILAKLNASDLEASLKAAKANRAAQAAQIQVSRARLESQKANIRGIEASLAEARKTLQRQQQLYQSRDVSESAVDQARRSVRELEANLQSAKRTLEADQLNLEVLGHRVDSADADITRVEEDLEYTTIRSPIDGTVTRINAEEGETVITGTMNNPGTVILEVADLSEMLFIAQVDEADIGALEVGQPATITLQAYPDRDFEGTVEKIALKPDQSGTGTKYFETEIRMNIGEERIRVGLEGDARIITRRHEQAMLVPSQAVLGLRVDELPKDIRENDPNVKREKTFTPVVYRAVDGKALVTPVTIGPTDATRTLIEAGLEADAPVITGPYKTLENLNHDRAVKQEDDKAAPETKAAESSAPDGGGTEATNNDTTETDADTATDAAPAE